MSLTHPSSVRNYFRATNTRKNVYRARRIRSVGTAEIARVTESVQESSTFELSLATNNSFSIRSIIRKDPTGWRRLMGGTKHLSLHDPTLFTSPFIAVLWIPVDLCFFLQHPSLRRVGSKWWRIRDNLLLPLFQILLLHRRQLLKLCRSVENLVKT